MMLQNAVYVAILILLGAITVAGVAMYLKLKKPFIRGVGLLLFGLGLLLLFIVPAFNRLAPP